MTCAVHVYPSPMVNESRIERITASLEEAEIFGLIRLVGLMASDLPPQHQIGPRREIVRLGRPASAGESRVGKLRRMLSWFKAVYREHKNLDIRAVSAHSVWVLPVSYALARHHRAMLVYNPHELETRAASVTGLKRLTALLIERLLIPKCAVMTVVNESIADWYARSTGRDDIVTVRNIPEVDAGELDLRQAVGVDTDTMLFIHTGRLVPGRNIPLILEAFEALNRSHVVFLGDGKLSGAVNEAANRSGNIHLLPPVPTRQVVHAVRQADVALVLIEATCLSYKLSSPNKLFEALAADTPPLCTDLPEARRHLQQLDEWILRDEQALFHRVRELDRSDVMAFKNQWPGLPTWSEEVSPLVTAYSERAPAGVLRRTE